MYQWKALLVACAAACTAAYHPTGLAVYAPKTYQHPLFVPKRRRQSRVLFLDEAEKSQPYGRGEIDLTQSYSGKIKFDDTTDYDFTSPGDEKTEIPSGKERYYDLRLRPPYSPQYYQGRFRRPYAPFDPYYAYVSDPAPVVRNSFFNPNQGWKARSPRVVFPYQEPANNQVQTNSHGGPGGFNDNVVFREQNFGLSDVGTDDLALQDIEASSGADAFSERDANVPHRPLNDNTKRMDIKTNIHIKNTKYIPIYKHHDQNPMFIQTDGSKILPPDLEKSTYYEFKNLTRDIGGQSLVLPKFKPISDEQIIRINEILNQSPISTKVQPNRNSTKKGRRAKILNDSTNSESQNVVVTEKTDTDRQDEKLCPQGGTCEFFVYCWMVGGLLEGTCGGLLKGCCHRVAKAGILGVQDSNSIEYGSNELSYGPVINDQSKSFVFRAKCGTNGKT